ncbi:hypothetical protein EVB88_065 [Rhizobium phage RHph_N28_2]|nr:hypothetical protein EVB88_065 [Rhizobium phage RHph_N28_2]
MTDAHGVARDQLRAFIERIERLEEEKKTIADDIKDVYAEAKGMGFIPAMMKKVIALRKKDEQERAEEEAILDTYLHALGMISQPDLFEEPHHPKTGEIIDPKLSQAIVAGMQTEIGRKALITAVDIMIAREEADEEFQAKASGDNGATVQAEKVPADSVTGDVSRSSRGDGSPAPIQPETATKSGVGPLPGAAGADGTHDPAEDERDVEAAGGAALVLTNSEIGPSEDRSEGHSLDVESADANTGGDHVTAQPHRAAKAGALVKPAPAAKSLRPYCRNPGERCGGYGSTHCASCLRATRESEVAA